MSTQAFSSIPTETQNPLTTEATEEHREQPKSVLDEPWRVRMLPPAEAEERKKCLPWKMGDVARLKDDSPEGMMKYIATHTTGWWQEMAERALRDTEKAQRMAEEAGWQPGQYWSLEVDAEAKERMLAQEEARRQREEAERAKEAAEKEAFARRQMELLKKAGKAPRCEYTYTDGRGCRAPQVRGERWCHGHAKMMSYRPEKLELEPMEDENAVMVNLHRVTRSLLSGRITEKMGGLMLWSVAIAAPCVRRVKRFSRESTRMNANGGKEIGTSDHRDIGSSEKQRLEPQRTRRTQRKRGGDRKSKTYHGGTETRRRVSRESTRMNANGKTGHRDTATRRTRVSGGRNGHSGVTTDKSFRFGVEGGVARRARQSGDLAIG